MRMSMTASGRLAGFLAVSLVALVAGCGGGDDGDGGNADRPESVPSGAVAVIGGEQIMSPELKRQIAILRRAQRGGGKKLSAEQREQLASQALAQLLMRKALEQEAAERGVKVNKAEVRRDWRRTARQQFKTKQALRRFLGGQSVADVLAQLRLQALSEQILAQVSKEAGGGKDGAKAAKEFQAEFQKRWQEQTKCGAGYSAPGCD
jgi:hypothetical protein